ncbi:MAG: GGDEF domain-containing protein [Bacilli bacterium]|nr:GGDEF domain-containing protein [Bacilli bacterium]
MLDDNVAKELLKNIDETIILLDKDNNVIYANKDYSNFSDLIFKNQDGEFKIDHENKWIKITRKHINEITVIDIKDVSLYNCLLSQSTKDDLTGLLNRLGMRIKLDDIIDKEEKKQLCFVMCDIDFFKNVNDTYGHDIGDIALIEISNILKTLNDDSTFVTRFGGEEFLVIFENKNIDFVLSKIETIRQKIANEVIYYNNNCVHLTMSFGIYCHCSKKIDIKKAIKKADIALYESKNNGRNTITIYNNKKS